MPRASECLPQIKMENREVRPALHLKKAPVFTPPAILPKRRPVHAPACPHHTPVYVRLGEDRDNSVPALGSQAQWPGGSGVTQKHRPGVSGCLSLLSDRLGSVSGHDLPSQRSSPKSVSILSWESASPLPLHLPLLPLFLSNKSINLKRRRQRRGRRRGGGGGWGGGGRGRGGRGGGGEEGEEGEEE